MHEYSYTYTQPSKIKKIVVALLYGIFYILIGATFIVSVISIGYLVAKTTIGATIAIILVILLVCATLGKTLVDLCN